MPTTLSERWAGWIARTWKGEAHRTLPWLNWIVASCTLVVAIQFALRSDWEIALLSASGVLMTVVSGFFLFERDGFLRLLEAKDAEIERLKKVAETSGTNETATP